MWIYTSTPPYTFLAQCLKSQAKGQLCLYHITIHDCSKLLTRIAETPSLCNMISHTTLIQVFNVRLDDTGVHARLEVRSAMTMNIPVFWGVKLHSLLDHNQRFGGNCWLHIHGRPSTMVDRNQRFKGTLLQNIHRGTYINSEAGVAQFV
jgi:hypothetical protein